MSRLTCISTKFLLLALLAGCGAKQSLSPRPPIAFEPWSYHELDGVEVRTEHYLIRSTLRDREVLTMLAQVMEGALVQYRQFTPGVRASVRPMECYVFADRAQWARFTAERTGDDATVYLKINRGGYSIRDWYVAYFIGDIGTYAVAAHEGWHQYVARHFKSRLPPFLEEGIASMFESIDWSDGRPHWALSINPSRAERLRRAIETRSLWPLETLITMHAGDVVHLSGERIETFYAQNWAFAQFLWEANDARHRPALQRMLADLAAGTVPVTLAGRRSSMLWNPESARPQLEYYLGMPIEQIERDYVAYMTRIARQQQRFQPYDS